MDGWRRNRHEMKSDDDSDDDDENDYIRREDKKVVLWNFPRNETIEIVPNGHNVKLQTE
jgi:hypothetical protein